MADVKDGGPAFPFEYDSTGFFGEPARNLHTGMTLRDWFAGMALQGMLAGYCSQAAGVVNVGLLAHEAYDAADAMLKAREAGE